MRACGQSTRRKFQFIEGYGLQDRFLGTVPEGRAEKITKIERYLVKTRTFRWPRGMGD
jgi:hypothetical protein